MDPITIGSLAASAVTLLAPYLARAAETLVPKAAEDLYAALRGKLVQKPAAAEALDDLEKTPTDADTQAALRAQLKKVLSEDDAFAAQVQMLVESADRPKGGSAVTAANRGVGAGRDINAPTFTGDIQGGVDIGSTRPPRGQSTGE